MVGLFIGTPARQTYSLNPAGPSIIRSSVY